MAAPSFIPFVLYANLNQDRKAMIETESNGIEDAGLHLGLEALCKFCYVTAP